MSMLLKMLMNQEKPHETNLAVVTDGGIIPLVGLNTAGLKAKLQGGKKYHITFSIDIKIETIETEVQSWAIKIRLGHHEYWKSPAAFMSENQFAAGENRHIEIDIISECFKDDLNGTSEKPFTIFVDNCTGTIHCYNLVITEV